MNVIKRYNFVHTCARVRSHTPHKTYTHTHTHIYIYISIKKEFYYGY